MRRWFYGGLPKIGDGVIGCWVLGISVGIIILMLILSGCTTGRYGEGREGFVSAEDWGARWAFRVEHGVIACRGSSSVVFISDLTSYALNGDARLAGRYEDVREIWRDAPAGSVEAKVSLAPFIEIGLGLCE